MPSDIDEFGGFPAESARYVMLAMLQRVPQSLGFQRGDCHALPVERVETTDRIAANQQTLRESGHFVVAPPPIGWDPVARDIANRVRGPQGSHSGCWREFLGKGDHSGAVGGRLFSQDSAYGEHRHAILVAAQR
ncbi:MAG TPA: hypothetical protein VMU34_24740, partial [Mycobacterium sp.]|nr:hypothetical protein [Mycobacterium sp.]